MADQVEVRFTRPHDKYGVRVRVFSSEDLTGETVTVTRKDGKTSKVKLTERVFPMRDGKPALYRFENVREEHPEVTHFEEAPDDELVQIIGRAPRSAQDQTRRERAAFQEYARRQVVAA